MKKDFVILESWTQDEPRDEIYAPPMEAEYYEVDMGDHVRSVTVKVLIRDDSDEINPYIMQNADGTMVHLIKDPETTFPCELSEEEQEGILNLVLIAARRPPSRSACVTVR